MIGMIPRTIPTFTNIWIANIDATPAATYVPNGSFDKYGILIARQIRMANSISTNAAPTNPNSSPTTVKMKSVCCSGTKSRFVCVPPRKPAPNSPPAPDRELGLGAVVVRGVLRVLPDRGMP